MKFNIEGAITVLCFFALIVLMVGKPDILDGLIKRVNDTACEAKP